MRLSGSSTNLTRHKPELGIVSQRHDLYLEKYARTDQADHEGKQGTDDGHHDGASFSQETIIRGGQLVADRGKDQLG